jgi:hypothetical protein
VISDQPLVLGTDESCDVNVLFPVVGELPLRSTELGVLLPVEPEPGVLLPVSADVVGAVPSCVTVVVGLSSSSLPHAATARLDAAIATARIRCWRENMFTNLLGGPARIPKTCPSARRAIRRADACHAQRSRARAKLSRMVNVGVVVLGVDDVATAAAFWCAALGYERRGEPFGGWSTVLVPRDGNGAVLAMQRSDQPAEVHPRIHLDLHVASAQEQAAEVERLVALGAQLVDWDRYPDDPDFVVLADPAGNRFCIVDLSHD